MIERWLSLPAYRNELAGASINRDEQSIRAITAAQLAVMQPLAETVFNNFLDLVGRPSRRAVLPSRHAVDQDPYS